MASTELENLVKTGKLKREPPATDEIVGLVQSAVERLTDAARTDLTYSSRFDLAYNAAHALALAALRLAGYRSDNRYLVFQVLAHTVGMAAEKWRVLAAAHGRRNAAEYEGHLERDERLLGDMIAIANELRASVESAAKRARHKN